MRRFQLGLALIALPVFACTLFLAGCGKDDKKPDNSNADNTNPSGSQQSGPAKLLEAKGGVLKGHVTLKEMPNTEELTKKLLAEIADKKDQTAFCMSGIESEKTEQAYRIGENKYLGNVFVWIQPEAGTLFKVDETQLAEAKKNPVVFRQPHCAFIPHCAIVFAEYHPDPKKPRDKKPTGQIIRITNDAPNGHNTDYKAGPNNPSKNLTIPPGEERLIENLHADPKEMSLSCGIHKWMDAYVRLLDTPYYAITSSDTLDKDKVKKEDAKFGTYEIKNLPIGKVRVFAWHERAGFLNSSGSGKEGDLVEIKEAGTEKNFEAKPK